jgi:hypothetical protein
MISNAFLATIAVLLAYGFWLMDQLKFMAPYKSVLFHNYGTTILIAMTVLFLKPHVTRERYIKVFEPAVLAAMQKMQASLSRAPVIPHATSDWSACSSPSLWMCMSHRPGSGICPFRRPLEPASESGSRCSSLWH